MVEHPIELFTPLESDEWVKFHPRKNAESISDTEWCEIREEGLYQWIKNKGDYEDDLSILKESIVYYIFDPDGLDSPDIRIPGGPKRIPRGEPIRYKRIWNRIRCEWEISGIKIFEKQFVRMLEELIGERRVEKIILLKYPHTDRNKQIEIIPKSHIEVYYRLRWALSATDKIIVDRDLFKTDFEAALAVLKRHNLLAEFDKEKHIDTAFVNECRIGMESREKWDSEHKMNIYLPQGKNVEESIIPRKSEFNQYWTYRSPR